VCSAPFPRPVMGEPGYRRKLAAVRAAVCEEHLAGNHLLGGQLQRYCANHHQFHSVSEFGHSTRVTCTRARELVASKRLKRASTGLNPEVLPPAAQSGVAVGGPAESLRAEVLNTDNPLIFNGCGFDFDFSLPLSETLYAGTTAGTRSSADLTIDSQYDVLRDLSFAGGAVLEASGPTSDSLDLFLLSCADRLFSSTQEVVQLTNAVTREQLARTCLRDLRALDSHLEGLIAGDQARAHAASIPTAAQQYATCRDLLATATICRASEALVQWISQFRECALRMEVVELAPEQLDAISNIVEAFIQSAIRFTSQRFKILDMASRSRIASHDMTIWMAEMREVCEHVQQTQTRVYDLVRLSRSNSSPEEYGQILKQVIDFMIVRLSVAKRGCDKRQRWLDELESPFPATFKWFADAGRHLLPALLDVGTWGHGVVVEHRR